MSGTGALAGILSWLSRHPDLPVSGGLTLYPELGGDPTLSVNLDTPEQVQVWAEALNATVAADPYKGTVQHTFYVYEPFHVTVTAIVPDEVTA